MVNEDIENPLAGIVLHDTALTSVQLRLDQLECIVEVEGSSGALPRGERVMLYCQGLHSFFASFNFAQMLDNARSGNVQDGRYHANGVFRVYVTGGMLEAGATSMALSSPGRVDDCNSEPAMPASISGFKALYDVQLDFGFLQQLDISLTLGTVTARVLMRDRDGDPLSELVPAVLTFSKVKSCNMRLDVAAMKESTRFGNISNNHVNVKNGIFWMYCLDGFVEIVAKEVVLNRCG